MRERLQYNETARKQYDELIENCPWFDINEHFLVTIDDSSGNIEEIVGAGLTFKSAKPAIINGWKRVKENYGYTFIVNLYEKGRLRSYVV